MSEPLRTSADSVPPAGPERDALIEKLLLAGLDHYFEGSYEQAVTVWTRVAFLERGHGRARAYIERARAALAERQRRAEELLHRGIEAYQAGDLPAARDLLSRAVADGGANETALVFLQRLGRAQAVDFPLAHHHGDASTGHSWPFPDRVPRAPSAADAAPLRRGINWIATAAVSVLLAAVILLAAQPIASWLGERPVAAPLVESRPAEPPPLVRASEIRIARARALHASGRHREALLALEPIGIADPLRGESERLEAEIQQALLGGADSSGSVEDRP